MSDVTRRMRIVQVVGTAGATGVESVVANLAEDLAGTTQVSVVCLAEGPLQARLRSAGVDVVGMRVRSKMAVAALRPLWRYLRASGADLVHTHGARAMLFGNLAAVGAGVRHVVTTLHECVGGRVKRGMFTPLELAVERTVGRWTVARWVAVSDEVVADAVAHRGISREQIVRIYNGVDGSRFRPRPAAERASLRAALGWRPDEFIVAGAGRLVSLKNYDVLLRAFERSGLARRGTLVIAGDGPERPALEDLARSLDIHEHVQFLGSRDDLPRWLPLVDVFVQPSSSEALGLSLLEAMACACASVASRTGGLQEIIEQERTGLFVPVGDVSALAEGLLRLAADGDLRSQLGAAAREDVLRRFSREANARHHLALYVSLSHRGTSRVN